ncbi:hypothetical protein BDV32DRAFT_123312 [Aspergillus pseudonomiae]|uniref:Uncharacterized protein n=1 Tax=Aspergillus pseudonomiae TaxID=1506151 RepID=A0A5N7DMB0_9EURO|nr:uncharacterized protein BDV37DRAFT_241175 [Aspergillus pseudonomiae]KAB8260187.1 hypothetical protein BDV32DRAFT_123312 [Aspergillus pseudonomiae]KAE8407189.1 hypothetical protein BDV37DRAFT_241175 [Aspergillus pseudonomiae]
MAFCQRVNYGNSSGFQACSLVRLAMKKGIWKSHITNAKSACVHLSSTSHSLQLYLNGCTRFPERQPGIGIDDG